MSDQTSEHLFPVLISLGSNLNPEANLSAAVELLSGKADDLIISSVWKTPAVGSSGPDYLNMAVVIFTNLPPQAIKSSIISPLENMLGRIRSDNKYMDRTIDLDILIYNDLVIDPELWTQAHLAIPASELMPKLINGETGETLQGIAIRLLSRAGISRHPLSDEISTPLEL